jgi:WXG100 family type VII secretion target
MANVNVTYEEMQNAAAQLQSGQAEIDGQLAQLSSLVQNLVSGGYVTDSSSPQFQAAYEEFNTGARNVIEGLTGMSNYLSTAARTFQEADASLANMINR